MKKNLIIHIGHGKTGTSYIQSVLALNIELLSSLGITYPEAKTLKGAVLGEVTAGHSKIFDSYFAEDLPFDGKDTILLSGEFFFRSLLTRYEGKLVDKLAKEYDLTVVCFTRDLMEYSISGWSEVLKAGGYVEDIDTFLRNNVHSIHSFLNTWIDKSKELGFKLILKNYSKHKDDLLETFFNSINLPINDLVLPSKKRINRRLTHTETEYQRLFNQMSFNGMFLEQGKSELQSFPSTRLLMKEFPEIKVDRIKMSQRTYDAVVEANQDSFKKINEYLPIEESLEYGSMELYVRGPNDIKPMPTYAIEKLAESIDAFIHKRDSLIEQGVELQQTIKNTTPRVVRDFFNRTEKTSFGNY